MMGDFHLIETMRHESDIAHLDRHLERLSRSAVFFGIPLDVDVVRESVRETCVRLEPLAFPFRLRLGVFRDGRHELAVRRVDDPPPPPRRVQVSETRIEAHDVFRRHKTSNRELYDAEYGRAVGRGLFEILYINESGRVAEGSRTNIFARAEGNWLTPHVDDGALPGVYRSYVLETNPAARESQLTVADLTAADAVYVCNAVIGMVEVQLIDSASSLTER